MIRERLWNILATFGWKCVKIRAGDDWVGLLSYTNDARGWKK